MDGRPLIERLESRQLLSATFAVTALPANAGYNPQAFNDAGQVAGSSGNGGFFYSGGKATEFSYASDMITVGSMNASGQVVGFVSLDAGPEAFLYSGGKLTLLGLFGGTSSAAVAINKSGVIAGSYVTSAGITRGFIYSGGKMTDIGTLGGANTSVSGMNDLGQVVGNSQLAGGEYNAYVYSAGKMIDIDSSTTRSSVANAINNAGQIIGQDSMSGFLYSKGKLTRLQLKGGGISQPDFLNANGDVAGIAFNSATGEYDLFLLRSGVLQDLGDLGNQSFNLTGFNNSDELIGVIEYGNGNAPFLYANGAFQTISYDASAIAPQQSSDSFLGVVPQTLVNFDLVNNNGQIVADDGVHDDYLLSPAKVGSISGTVFHDLNADGVQQSTEPSLAGLLVYVDVNNTGSFMTGDPMAKTTSSGHYVFANLAPGPYIIRFVPPTSNWKQSVQSLALGSGASIVNANFGTLQLYSFSVTDLGTLGGTTSIATSINNVGQIVGQSDTASATGHPFLYTISTGKMTDLSSMLGANAQINCINDLGQMVGDIPTGKTDSSGNILTKAFLYSNGKLTILPQLAGNDSNTALGINDKGQIVGFSTSAPSGPYAMTDAEGFIYSGGKLGGLPPYMEFGAIDGLAINNSGQIFENYSSPPFKDIGSAANYLYSAGKLLLLPLGKAVSAPGPWFGSPVDPSLANTVGFYDPFGTGLRNAPASFYSGTQAVTLNDTLSAKSGWMLNVGNALDSANDIVGQGINPTGKTHAFLLTPVLASITGNVFNDLNGDGVKQSGESGLAGWTVYADLNGSGKFSPNDPHASTTAAGNYTIPGLPAGGFVIRIVAKTGYRQTAPTTAAQTLVAAGQTAAGPPFGEVATGPVGGKPTAFGKIQAENFDFGGQGSGYYNPGNINRGGLYRPAEGVGIGAIPSADGGGYFVGYTLPGEWLDYNVTVAATGTYTLNFRVSSTPAGGKFHLDVDGVNVTGTLAIPNTGSFNTYQAVSKSGIHLTAGTHVLRLMIDSAGSYGAAGNFDWFDAVKM